MASFYNYTGNLEAFHLFWLDEGVNCKENLAAQDTLRTMINHLQVFEKENECIQSIKQVPKDDRVVLIISGRMGREVVPRIHTINGLSSIYVYCQNMAAHKQWADQFEKVVDVFADFDKLLDKIRSDQKQRTLEEDSVSMFNIFNVSGSLDDTSTGINGQFVHCQLLIDVLVRMKPNEKDRAELINLCRKEYANNTTELEILEKFAATYSSSEAVWWYTTESFIYKILNRALRVLNVDLLFLFRFFIRDVEFQLRQNQLQSSVTLYRGQMMSSCELERLEKSTHQLISINSFFSTSIERDVAVQFLKNSSNASGSQLKPVLFEIYVDPQIGLTKPFADIRNLSVHKNESEVLFMLGSIFRLDEVKHVENGGEQMTIIKMPLCGDKHGLKKLYKHMKKHNGIGETNLLSFANVLRLMGKYDDAEKYYRRCLYGISANDLMLGDLYYNLGLVLKYRCEYAASFELHEKALTILMRSRPSDSLIIGNIYNSIGEIHWEKHEHEQALQSFKQAVQLFEQARLIQHSDMALFLDNIGLVCQQQKNYPQALIHCSKSLSIRQNCLPSNHPHLAMSYNNVGMIRWQLDHVDLAIELLQEALNIRNKALPNHHPDIAVSYRNLGVVYESTGQYKRALKSFQQALEIYSYVWKDDHPKIVEIKKYIEHASKQLQN